MKKVLVLGASGYVGSQLILYYLNKVIKSPRRLGKSIILPDRTPKHKNLTIIYLDLADQQQTCHWVKQADLVYF
ncbi:NAD-dependent epimerase/dehydratase family protein [Vibrio metschnikovii]